MLPGEKSYPYRPYFDINECIFIHIPKVAGTSILKALTSEAIFRDHCTYREFQCADGAKFRQYFKFCFVRHPVDRLLSVYNYWRQGGNGKDDLYFSSLLNEKYTSIELFVFDYLDENRIHEHRLLIPQYLYVHNHKHELMVDFVGSFEKINEDFKIVARHLGLKGNLSHKNKTRQVVGSIKPSGCSEGVVNRIEDLYKHDFSLFDY